MTSHHARGPHRRMRRAFAGVAAVVGIVAVVNPQPDAGAENRFCSLAPAPDAMPTDPGILGSVRVVDGVLAVLHRVDCDGHTLGWRWVVADDIVG